MQVIKLDATRAALVQQFCDAAKAAGYTNNESFEKMKFDGKYDLQHPANFWGLMVDEKLVSVSGSHWLKTIKTNPSFDSQRCLFRSATLPGWENIIPGLSKYHMNSVPWSILMPYQIRHGKSYGIEWFIITTSSVNDASGRMFRTHKALALLSKLGIVHYECDEVIFYTPQTKWRLDLDRYLDVLRDFHPTRQRLGIGLDPTYYDIIENGF